MEYWMRWVGLPHKFGVHPESGEAADCLLMVWAVLERAGIPHPDFDQEWLDLAELGHWSALEEKWKARTRLLEAPCPYALTLFKNGRAGLGVGVVIDGGVLMIHHKRGVCWLPTESLQNLSYYEFV
jgi:hypothetical protein